MNRVFKKNADVGAPIFTAPLMGLSVSAHVRCQLITPAVKLSMSRSAEKDRVEPKSFAINLQEAKK